VRVTIERAYEPTPDIADLIGELDRTLAASYPPEQRHGIPLERLFEPNVRFFLACVDGAAVGCGAIALFDDYAEVKRMFTKPAMRGRGLARAVLVRLEEETRSAGFALLRLETGIFQPDAVHVYEAHGFTRCEPFGPYRDMPNSAIGMSLYYEKRVS